jgi:phosphoglycerate dehydrogenase-like enzyme
MLQVILFGPTACHNEARLKWLLQSEWRIIALPDESDSQALLYALPRTDALISLLWRREWGASAARLKLIQALGAGIDAYDTEGLPAGCALCNVYEHSAPVAEYVIGAMVALTARFVFHDRRLREGHWDGCGRREGAPHPEMAGKTVGLIGFGGIGREVARRARAFEMRVHATRANALSAPGAIEPDWLGSPDQLRELLAASDYLVVCCPLNAQTRGMLNRETLAWLKPGAYLINVARAEIIEEEALFDALKRNRIAGAALDVWYRYPATLEQRLPPSALPFHELENVLMTPHLSAWTDAMIERRWRKIAANLDALAEGRELENVAHLAEAEDRS